MVSSAPTTVLRDGSGSLAERHSHRLVSNPVRTNSPTHGGDATVSQLGAARARRETHLIQLECRADDVEQDEAATSPIADGALLP
jgi:hypothetical protein